MHMSSLETLDQISTDSGSVAESQEKKQNHESSFMKTNKSFYNQHVA